MRDASIVSVKAREILDSRATPTVEAEVRLADGSLGIARVPSGASTGKYEAYEMRDREGRYGGKGVLRAVANINGEIARALAGKDATNQGATDRLLRALDGTPQKKNLGANAILGVSMAVARAAAAHFGMPLWRYLGGAGCCRLPIPMMNVINGGAHAANPLDVQEFMIVPVGAENFAEGVRMGAEVYRLLGGMLKTAGFSTGVGDEGGYAPELASPEEAMKWLTEAIDKAGYTGQIKIALDMAASEWQDGRSYRLPKSGAVLSGDDLIKLVEGWTDAFPLLSVEDPLGEDDAETWRLMTDALGDRLMLVGDDLFVTNTARLQAGIREGCGNAILIKPNQIGTLSETIEVIAVAKEAGYRHILSHRSGETEDTLIADLAVATQAPFIKSGAPCRSERVAKYNRLLGIAEALGENAFYGLPDGKREV